MTDPRKALGYDVEPRVKGPYEVMAASRVGDGSDGGTLDRGLVARTEDGRPVVIGEVWAAGVGSGGSKVRLDASAIATDVVRALNRASGGGTFPDKPRTHNGLMRLRALGEELELEGAQAMAAARETTEDGHALRWLGLWIQRQVDDEAIPYNEVEQR